MAAITMNTAAIGVTPPYRGVQFLEDVTVTNGVGMGGTGDVMTKGLYVPDWATKVIFYIFHDSQAGTSPLMDFGLGVPDFGDATALGAPTDATDVATLGNAAWNGITQLTGTGAYQVVIEVGPDVTDDDTGSASASCYYGVKCELPPVITYTITLDSTTNDEDYRFRILAHWKA
jgi:hypothetical protein